MAKSYILTVDIFVLSGPSIDIKVLGMLLYFAI